jgi:predicted DNA-binding transcriptional regulator YafY
MTAGELAQSLGVSIRTIYRDMDALSNAGIPVYAERGPDGGCCLMDHYRTELTGLTGEEARALFFLTSPGPLDSLGVGEPLRNALRKLFASIPNELSSPPSSPAVFLDWSGWGARSLPEDILARLYQAVLGRQKVNLAYRLDNYVPFQQVICPLGLVAKAGVWYLVFQVGPRYQYKHVSAFEDVTLLDDHFDFPQGFDLRAYWQKICDQREDRARQYTVVLAVDRAVLPMILNRYPDGVVLPDQGTRARMELHFEYLEDARSQLLGWGGAVEVLEPLGLRLSIADYAQQVLNLY